MTRVADELTTNPFSLPPELECFWLQEPAAERPVPQAVDEALAAAKMKAVRLDAMAKAKEDALATSQQTLDEDAKKFEDYLQERIAKASSATKESEMHAKVKQDKVARIKSLRQQISAVQSETSKLKEVRVECERYKMFLEKITPGEWKEDQRKKKEQRKKERAERWKKERLAPIMEQLAQEEEKLFEKIAQEEAEAEASKKRGKKQRRREDEEELLQRQRERDNRRKRIQKRREEEERKVNAEYVAVSSEEEPELFFKEPQQLMDSFTDLEELNLFLIQSSQEAEQQLDEIRNSFEAMKKNMGHKVQQLKDQITQLEQSIKQEQRRGEEIKQSHAEKASTATQDKKLSSLAKKVHEVYTRCNLARDQQQQDTLQMLGAIESRIEELIQGLDEAFQQDEDLVMRLEKIKEGDRRERVRENRLKEQSEKQEDRLKQSLQRSQKPVFKKAGKQVMYRSPPLRQERKVVEDTTDDEAHARDHKVFDIYIDRKTGVPHTDAPVEESRRAADRGSGPLRTIHEYGQAVRTLKEDKVLSDDALSHRQSGLVRQGPAPGLGQERVPQWPQQPQQPPLGSGLEPGIARDHRAHWLDGRLDAAVGKHNLYDPSQLGGSNLLFDLKIGQEHAKENRPGSIPEGLQVLQVAMQLMRKGQLLEAKKALTAALHLLGTSRDVLPVAAELRHQMGLTEASLEEIEVWLEWRTSSIMTCWQVVSSTFAVMCILLVVYFGQQTAGIQRAAEQLALITAWTTGKAFGPVRHASARATSFECMSEPMVGSTTGHVEKIHHHTPTSTCGVDTDADKMGWIHERSDQNLTGDLGLTDLREPEAEEHVEDCFADRGAVVAKILLAEEGHDERSSSTVPTVREEATSRDNAIRHANVETDDSEWGDAILPESAQTGQQAFSLTKCADEKSEQSPAAAAQAHFHLTKSKVHEEAAANDNVASADFACMAEEHLQIPRSFQPQPKRQKWRSRVKAEEPFFPTAKSQLPSAHAVYGDEVENVNVPSQLIGPVTYGKTTVEATNLDGKDDVSGLLTESTEEDWGWGAGRPKAASDGCIYFAGAPPQGRPRQVGQDGLRSGRRWQAGGRGRTAQTPTLEDDMLELDVKLEQDGNFFLAKPTRFRPLGCFLRLPGGREGFLPVEHITPRAEASTNGVRSTVTKSSKGGRVRVREIGSGRVSMLTPNEEAMQCKEIEERRRHMEDRIEQLRENYNPAKWLVGFVSAVQPNGVYVSVIDGQDARIPLKEMPEKFLKSEPRGNMTEDKGVLSEIKPTVEVGQAIQFRIVRYSWES
ncbi:FAP100, partial [Symbiodinium pilosum]